MVQSTNDLAVIEKMLKRHAVKAFGVNTLLDTLCPTFHLLLPHVGNIRAIPVYIIEYTGWFNLEIRWGRINDLYCHKLNPNPYPNCLFPDAETKTEASPPDARRSVSSSSDDSKNDGTEDEKCSTDEEVQGATTAAPAAVVVTDETETTAPKPDPNNNDEEPSV